MRNKGNIIDLAGEWRVRLDPQNEGIRNRWFAQRFADSIVLPGTTDEAEIGEFVDEQCADRLSRIWRWIGPAWYQTTVSIPETWEDKKIILFLERTKDSQVWVDETWMGSDDSLSTPHEFDLSKTLTPGEHSLSILIDNAKLPPVGPCHQVDERTQTNWNGIVGRIELQMREKIWISDLQAFPSIKEPSVSAVVTIINEMRWTGMCNVKCIVEGTDRDRSFDIEPETAGILMGRGPNTVTVKMPLPDDMPCWDEFDTRQLRLTVEIEAVPRAVPVRDMKTITFGLRDFAAEKAQFVINGRPVFLRGKNDSALFPLTGYAPMDKNEWMRLLRVAKSYGINHYRFHSWCPPEAAFAAADDVGIYFQVELPNKRGITAPENRDYKPPAEAYETLAELAGDGGPPAVRTAYLTREGERILKYYGNHPSFVMLTLGNELGGDVDVMNDMLEHFRGLDRRHIYAMGTGHFHWDIKYRPSDEFWVTRGTGPSPDYAVREASYESDLHVEHKPPSTTVDYSPALQGVPVPVVGHEIGQFEVYPDYREIEEYTGVLKARNLEIFRERLEAAGMLDQANDFLQASGALSTICHREGVEAALRTPGFGGFQMLDLQDFSGQGTALVGILNVFMKSKGLITPAKWREFCCETVPLLWMTKYTWTNRETFRGRIRLAHYGAQNLKRQALTWEINGSEKCLARGETRALDILTGTVPDVDLFCMELSALKKAQKLTVTLTVKGAGYRNSYPVWVYPENVSTRAPSNVCVTRSWTKKAQDELLEGGTVLLLPKPDKLKKSVAAAFQTSFWSPMFRKGDGIGPNGRETPGTQGILCDPRHPLFKDFPTEYHTNWQWWHLVKNSRPMILDSTPSGYRPLVQVIDSFARNHKLGLITEAKVGRGKLLICSIDLPALQRQPEGRQLLTSIYSYMRSPEFAPEHNLAMETITAIV